MYPRCLTTILSWRSVMILGLLAAGLQIISMVLSHYIEEAKIQQHNEPQPTILHHFLLGQSNSAVNSDDKILNDKNKYSINLETLSKSDILKEVQEVWRCSTTDETGEYRLFSRYITARPSTALNNDAVQMMHSQYNHQNIVTLVTQCSAQHLNRLPLLAQTWQGPVSIAVLSLPHELNSVLSLIHAMRICYPSVRANVTFSLVLPNNRPEQQSSAQPILDLLKDVDGNNDLKLLSPLSEKFHYQKNSEHEIAKRNADKFNVNNSIIDQITAWVVNICLSLFEYPLRYSRRKFNISNNNTLYKNHNVTSHSKSSNMFIRNVNRKINHIISNKPVQENSTVHKHCSNIIMNNVASFRKTVNYALNNVKYPNNLLRNVAVNASATEFVFVLDIDILPSEGLHTAFKQLMDNKKQSQHRFKILNKLSNYFGTKESKVAYILPAYEVEKNTDLPRTKADLLHLVQKKSARPFYAELCSRCHAPTNYSKWEQLNMAQNNLAVSYEVTWRDPWEPFFITTADMPLFDPRFKQFGFNRISHACELHIAGYKFEVLSAGFVIHDGFKTPQSFHSSKQSELETNRLLFRNFKQELKTKYPNSPRRCY